MNNSFDQLCINNMRFLAVNAAEKAIMGALVHTYKNIAETYKVLAIENIRASVYLMHPIYDSTGATDG